MIPFLRPVATTALAVLLLAASPRDAGAADVPVTDDFVVGQLKWSQGRGTLSYAWTVTTVEGQPMVCGVAAYAPAGSKRMLRDALEKAWIKAQGRKVLRNLSFFADAPSPAALSGARAACKPVAARPSADGFELGFDPFMM